MTVTYSLSTPTTAASPTLAPVVQAASLVTTHPASAEERATAKAASRRKHFAQPSRSASPQECFAASAAPQGGSALDQFIAGVLSDVVNAR